MEIFQGAQTTYQIGYHIVWGVKYHKDILQNNNMKEFLAQSIKQICDYYQYHFLCVGMASNHVHLFVGAPPKIAPAKITQVVKSISAREIYKTYPYVRKHLWGGEIWKNGYYVGTVGEGQTEDKVRSYIQKQGNLKEKTMKQLRLFY